MKKLVSFILLLSCLAYGDANFNDDCIVNLEDFAIFAADWLNSTPLNDPDTDLDSSGDVDLDDLLLFSIEWLEYKTLDRSPIADDQSLSVFNIATKTVTLTATDENDDELEYTILSLPDPSEGVITGVSSVPHTLAGDTFVFDPCDTYLGDVSILFQVDDQTGLTPPCGGTDTGVITISVGDSPTDPSADNVNVSAITYVAATVELSAEDDGWPTPPGAIKYIVTSLPTYGTLRDPQNGYDVIDSVPYTIVNWGNTLVFISDTTGGDSFEYQAFDGGYDPLDGYSNTATVSVTVSANLTDSLYFDGFGYVSFADNAKYDITSGWGMDVWVLCDPGQVNVGIAKKWDGTGTGKGWEFGIVSGKPKFYMHDGAGNTGEARHPYRIDDGAWHEVAFIVTYSSPNVSVYIKVDGVDYEPIVFSGISDYGNSEPMVVGLHTRYGYRCEFDKLRFFSGITDPLGFGGMIQGFSGRTESGNETVLGFGKVSDVLFMCDEGTGTTITDSKLSLTGTFNSGSNVLWTPPIRLYNDASVKQYQYMNGGNE